jgi:hypothetical protein
MGRVRREVIVVKVFANILYFAPVFGWWLLLHQLMPPLMMRDWPVWEVVPTLIGIMFGPPVLFILAIIGLLRAIARN